MTEATGRRRQPLGFVVRNALSRFRRMTPWRLAADLRRAARLKREPMAPRRERHARAERVVVTFTTIPERAAGILPTIHSLLDQTWPPDRIAIAWPEATRNGAPYPAPPLLPPGVDLLPCTDEGPATKLLPALKAEPDAVLVVVDDDVIYPVDFLETLLRAHRADRVAALGWRGNRIDRTLDPRDMAHIFATAVAAPTDVDVLMGTWGFLIPPGSLDGAVHDFGGWAPELRWIDDFWISGHLAKRGVPRRVIPARGLPLETRLSLIGGLQRIPNPDGRNHRVAIESFAAWW